MANFYKENDEPVPGYHLIQRLGQGGFGEVWKAAGPGGAEQALKIIGLSDGQGLKEFRAVRLVKNVRHPNLVPIFGIWAKDEDGKLIEDSAADDSVNLKKRSAAELIIAMGLGEKSLAQRLKECVRKEGLPGIPARELLRYFDRAAEAIDFLNDPCHDMGSGPVAIQHGDIKPHNVLIVGGAAQICDFGLARLLDNVRSTTTAAAFSPAYVPPEMLPPDVHPHRTSDQYSLAISYVELRTGSLPFTAKNQFEAIEIQRSGRLELGKLPAAEQSVIRKATSLNPDKRFPSCSEMVQNLCTAAASLTRTSGSGVHAAVSLDNLLQAGSTLVHGHQLVRLLGRGGYGEVWEAKVSGGIPCALKVVRSLDAAKGKQEFRSLELIKNLEHDHLLQLQQYWLLDSLGLEIQEDRWADPNAPVARMLVIRTALAAKNLMQRWTECQEKGLPGIPPEELLDYVRQAASALDYLNRQSIQHRDVKPENLLLTKNGKVLVSDFGLAKLLGGTSATINSQSQGMSLPYAAPEIFHSKVSRWTDQYSLTLTYFKLRTGQLPFSMGLSYVQRAFVHAEGHFDLSAIEEPERSVLARATREKPEERYPSCLALVAELEAAIRKGPAPVVRPPVTPHETGARPSSPSGSGRPIQRVEPVPTIPAPVIPSLGVQVQGTSEQAGGAPTATKSDAPPTGKPGSQKKTDRPEETSGPDAFPDDGGLQHTNIGLVEGVAPDDPMEETIQHAPQRRPEPPKHPTRRRKAPAHAGVNRPNWTREREKGHGVWIGAAVALVVVGLAAGLVWRVIPRDPEPTTLTPRYAEEVRKLIDDREFAEAYKRLSEPEIKETLPKEEAAKLHSELASAWVKPARKEFDRKHYRKAKEALTAPQDCYPDATEIRQLGQEIRAKEQEHETLKKAIQADLVARRWDAAETKATEMRNQSPEWADEAAGYRNDAAAGRRSTGVERAMKEAEGYADEFKKDLAGRKLDKADSDLTSLKNSLLSLTEDQQTLIRASLARCAPAVRQAALDEKDTTPERIIKLVGSLRGDPFGLKDNVDLALAHAAGSWREAKYGLAVDELRKAKEKISAQNEDFRRVLGWAATSLLNPKHRANKDFKAFCDGAGGIAARDFKDFLGFLREQPFAGSTDPLAVSFGNLVESWVSARMNALSDAIEENEMDGFCKAVHAAGAAGPWTRARLGERLAEDNPKESLALAEAALGTKDSPARCYAEYVRARALGKENVEAAADALMRAFVETDSTASKWHSGERKAWSRSTLHQAADQAVGKNDPARAKKALKYCQTAERLGKETSEAPIEDLIRFVRLARFARIADAGEDKAFEEKLKLLVDHKDFKDRVTAAVRAEIGIEYVKWAEEPGKRTAAEALLKKRGMVLVLQAAAAKEPTNSKVSLWLGKHLWKQQAKSEAIKYFGRALAHSKESHLDSRNETQFKHIIEWIGSPLAKDNRPENKIHEDWQKIFDEAIGRDPKARTIRQWELAVAQCTILVSQPELRDSDLKSDKPKILRLGNEIVAAKGSDGKDLPIIQSEGHALCLSAFTWMPKEVQEKYVKEQGQHYQEYAALMLTQGTKLFRESPSAKGCAPEVIGYLQMKKRDKDAKMIQAYLDAAESQAPNRENQGEEPKRPSDARVAVPRKRLGTLPLG